MKAWILGAVALMFASGASAVVVEGGCCDNRYQYGDESLAGKTALATQQPPCSMMSSGSECYGNFYADATCDPVEGCVTEQPVCCAGVNSGLCVGHYSETVSFEQPASCEVPCLSDDDCVEGWCDKWGEVCGNYAPQTIRERSSICMDTVHPAKCDLLGGYAMTGSSCDFASGACVDPNDPPVCCVFTSPAVVSPTYCENIPLGGCQELQGQVIEGSVCGENGCEPKPEAAPFCCNCNGVGPFPNVCFDTMTPEQCLEAGCSPVAGGVCDPVTELCNVPITVTPTASPSATKTNTQPVLTATPTLTPVPTNTLAPTATATPNAVCGNDIVEPGEQCDPGADVEGDCCTADCQFEAAETTCDADGQSCTVDLCNASGVCIAGIDLPDGSPCDDGDACTEPDTCTGGICAGAAIDCDDGFDCTIDSCHPAVGCLNIATIESRDCPGSCTDGINNDPLDPNDPLHDPLNPENDNDVDFEDSGCATLGPLARFAVIATRDRTVRDLQLGSNTTVGSTKSDGTCNIDTNQCECPVVECEPAIVCTADSDCSTGACNTATNKCECTVNCPVAGQTCQGDGGCLFEVAGTCNGGTNLCECPDYAPNCQPLNRPCSDDASCAAAPFPAGTSIGGVCGNGMKVSAGTNMGLLASATLVRKLQFGGAEVGKALRTLDIRREFANAGGQIQVGKPAPFLGPTVCSDATTQVCRVDSDCAAGTCDARRRLGDGNAFQTSNGVPGAGFAGAGTSENFKRCDVALGLLRSINPSNPSVLQAAIEAYVPSPAETVELGPTNCLLCPNTDSLDAACTPCSSPVINLRTNAKTKKVVLTVGNGLQVIDLRRLRLAGKTVLVLRGEADTELMFRVERSLRSGTAAKMLLEGMTADQVLFVAMTRLGGKPFVSAASTWRGSILATERNGGILLGARSYTEGGVYSKKVTVKGPNTTIQHMPWKGKLPSIP